MIYNPTLIWTIKSRNGEFRFNPVYSRQIIQGIDIDATCHNKNETDTKIILHVMPVLKM